MRLKFLLQSSSNGLISATVSSLAYPILSYKISRKFKTLQQDSSSWHLVITTLQLFCKSCTGFPLQSALNASCMHELPCYKWIRSCLPLWTPTYLHSVSNASLFFRFPHAKNRTIQTQDSWLSYFHLFWTLCMEFTPTRHQAMLKSSIF